MVPVHDREQIAKLRASWIRATTVIRQPTEQLDDYFGLSLGLYFNFVELYGLSLAALLLAIIAGIFLGLGKSALSVMTITWSFGFILSWRHKQTTRSYTKGILNSVGRGWEEARPEHFGQGNSKITFFYFTIVK